MRAFAVAAGESDGTIGTALRAVAARAGLGADVGAGLRAVAGSTSVPAQWDRLAVCWQLAADHGLAMAALIRAAQRDIVERQRFTARVEAGLAGARATAAILAGLPLLGVLLGELIGAHPVAVPARWRRRRLVAGRGHGPGVRGPGVGRPHHGSAADVTAAAVLLAVALLLRAGPGSPCAGASGWVRFAPRRFAAPSAA